MARIKLENLVKQFSPTVTAVAGVNLDIADGEFMIFVGPSGCGKTTTLNMIAGLEQPTSGNVIIGERVVNDLEPGERGLGMVFQNLALFPHMTVFENTFWASGQAFSVMSFPSIVGYGNANPESKIKGQQLSCVIPGVKVDGQLVRRAPQAAGTGYMVSHYSKHPELAYYFLQWLTGPTKGDEAIADGKGFWDPMRRSNLNNPAILEKFGKQFIETTMENAKYATSLLMLPGNEEYFNVLDKNLALVMQGNLSAEDAAKRIEKGWNRVTDDLGRQEQIQLWRSGVESGAYIDRF